MKKVRQITGIVLILVPLFIKAEVKEIPFTLDDRDRLIRTEQKVESIKTEMNARFEANEKRFDGIDRQLDHLFNFLWAIIGIFTAMMISVFGFAFWDRKLSLAPMKREEEKIKNALREFSKFQPKLAEILKNAGLL